MDLPDEIDKHLSDLKASKETVISDLNGNSAKVLDQELVHVQIKKLRRLNSMM